MDFINKYTSFEMSADKDTLGQRIRKHMEIRGLTKADLSKETGVPPETISYIVDGSTYNPRIATLLAISNYLEVSLDELVESKPIKHIPKEIHLEPKSEIRNGARNDVPLLEWKNVKYWLKRNNEFKKEEHTEWVTPQQKTSKNSFALKIPYQAQGIFPKNSIIIVDPQNAYVPSNYVLSSMKEGNPTIRKVFKENGKVYLNAVGLNLTAEEVNEENQILGEIVENHITFNLQE